MIKVVQHFILSLQIYGKENSTKQNWLLFSRKFFFITHVYIVLGFGNKFLNDDLVLT